jgi:peptidoglycan/xylan/chitin deacetylase (PgdA/CDA1 family)
VRWPESVLVDPNTSLPRSLLAACDGFDERCARYGESAELGLRLWGSGVRFRYEGAAITYQLYVKTARDVVLKDAWWFGRNEVYLCRKFPQYRAASALRGLGAGSLWKRTLREVASRSPVSPELLLRPPYWLAERFRRLAFARNAGIRLLDLRQRISNFRGALSEEGAWKELVGEFGMRLPVLMYHNVSPRRHTRHPELVVSPEAFARQLDLLKKRGYHAIRPSQWLGWVRTGERLPERPLLLTFDDGYADIAKYALPALHEHGFQAVVFLPTALLGGANPWDGEPLMNREQAIEWAGRGIEFGAHGRKHPDLTRLSPDELEEEIASSARDLCALLGRPAVSFAYPYGRCDERVQQAVSRHFAMAFGINEGLNRLETEVMNLRRTMVQPNDTWLDYRSRLSSGRSRFHRFRARLAAFLKRQ